MTQHLDDLVPVVSYTAAANKEANRVLGLSKGHVHGRPLPLNPRQHGRMAKVAADAEEALRDPTLPQEPVQPLNAAKAAALDRSLCLFKVLASVHYWEEGKVPAHHRELFVKLMVGSLRQGAASAAAFDTACSRVLDNLRALER